MNMLLGQVLGVLLGAITGGLLSVLASWLAQRTQTTGQRLAQEIERRQEVYRDFIEAAARSYAEALQQEEPDAANLTQLYGAMGRMRLHSSPPVIAEADRVTQKILGAYGDANRNVLEIRDFLAQHSIDLFSDFGRACRVELGRQAPSSGGVSWIALVRGCASGRGRATRSSHALGRASHSS